MSELHQAVAEYMAQKDRRIAELEQEVERLRTALERIRDVKYNSLSSGLAQCQEIAKQALKP